MCPSLHISSSRRRFLRNVNRFWPALASCPRNQYRTFISRDYFHKNNKQWKFIVDNMYFLRSKNWHLRYYLDGWRLVGSERNKNYVLLPFMKLTHASSLFHYCTSSCNVVWFYLFQIVRHAYVMCIVWRTSSCLLRKLRGPKSFRNRKILQLVETLTAF